MFIYSQWFLSYHGTFLAVYHGVRGRALGGLLSSVSGILGTWAFWVLADLTGWNQRQVLRRGYYIIFSLQTAVWIYTTVVQKIYSDTKPVGLDWVESEYWLSVVLYTIWSYVLSSVQSPKSKAIVKVTDAQLDLGSPTISINATCITS